MSFPEHAQAFRQRVIDVLDRGSIEQPDPTRSPLFAPHVVSGAFRGVPVTIEMAPAEDGGAASLAAVVLTVPMAPRPLRLFARGAGNVSSGIPEFRTGDAAFDQRFRTFGRPPEVMAMVLDEATRRNLGAALEWNGSLDVTDRELQLTVSVLDDAVWRDRLRPEELADPGGRLVLWLELGTSLTLRLPSAFDSVHAQRLGTAGAQAAADWLEAQRGRTRADRQLRKTLAVLLVVTVLGLIVLSVAATIAMFWLR